MNRYYYILVTSDLVNHNGKSLKEHLGVVDDELLKRAEVESSFSKLDTEELDHVVSTKIMFQNRMLPERLIIVDSENYGMYELASMEPVDCSNQEFLDSYEITGFDIVDIFERFPEYNECAINFFDIYRRKIDDEKLQAEEKESEKQKKIGIRSILNFIKGKSSN